MQKACCWAPAPGSRQSVWTVQSPSGWGVAGGNRVPPAGQQTTLVHLHHGSAAALFGVGMDLPVAGRQLPTQPAQGPCLRKAISKAAPSLRKLQIPLAPQCLQAMQHLPLAQPAGLRHFRVCVKQICMTRPAVMYVSRRDARLISAAVMAWENSSKRMAPNEKMSHFSE